MTSNQDLISVTAFFSAMVHAVIILGVSFTLPEFAKVRNPDFTLDVVLTNAPNELESEDAQLLSNQDSVGGGNFNEDAKTPLPYKPVPPQDIESIKKTATEAPNTKVRTDTLINAAESPVQQLRHMEEAPDIKITEQSRGPDKVSTKSARKLEMERLSAKISREWQAYQKRPRKLFLSPATKSHWAANYLAQWAKQVREQGNANFPVQIMARGLTGTVIMWVEMKPNGALGSIGIDESSGNSLLDQAAKRIVRDSAPFPPIPEEARDGNDVIVITRSFHFLIGNQFTTNDPSAN